MFEQYNILQKIFRIFVFVILTTIILIFMPNSEIGKDDVMKIVSAITIIFIIYDFYYPAVKIELKKENEN